MATSVATRLARSFHETGEWIQAACLNLPVLDMLYHNWHIGITSFGGPAVNYPMFHKKFVEELQWLNEQEYQHLFALCQALPGPGTTKMHYNIHVERYGLPIGMLAFLVWSLPMAIVAWGMSVGVANLNDDLPGPAYALLSGIDAATVGIVALGAYTLSRKAITDPLTRILVFLGGTAGMLYNALWYFPVLMIGGAIAAIVHDLRPWRYLKRRPTVNHTGHEEAQGTVSHDLDVGDGAAGGATSSAVYRRQQDRSPTVASPITIQSITTDSEQHTHRSVLHSWKTGIAIVSGFFVSLIVVLTLRGYLRGRSRGFDLFANIYLAGTIIFGGGPVVIPLLRQYVVAEGWVSPRDFLLGLALIQAFPGPNFNFAAYLGGLAVRSSPHPLPSIVGGMIGYIAIYAPGMILHTGTIGLWGVLRKSQAVRAALRGINASAVGLIFTAVYRLFQIGYIDENFRGGTSLARDPWWLVIVATSFVGGLNFKLSPPLAIVLGAIMGLIWFGVART